MDGNKWDKEQQRRVVCRPDGLLSDVVVFAAPLSALGARRARPRATPFAQQHLKFHGPPNSGRSVAEWAPSLKRATDACVLASNNASPAQRGPRRDAQPLHATPLAAVLFPAPLRAHTLSLCPLLGPSEEHVSALGPFEERVARSGQLEARNGQLEAGRHVDHCGPGRHCPRYRR